MRIDHQRILRDLQRRLGGRGVDSLRGVARRLSGLGTGSGQGGGSERTPGGKTGIRSVLFTRIID